MKPISTMLSLFLYFQIFYAYTPHIHHQFVLYYCVS
jgi:hypothetical protein